jgi:hypothetical protein
MKKGESRRPGVPARSGLSQQTRRSATLRAVQNLVFVIGERILACLNTVDTFVISGLSDELARTAYNLTCGILKAPVARVNSLWTVCDHIRAARDSESVAGLNSAREHGRHFSRRSSDRRFGGHHRNRLTG